jgi:hypothetical protein
LPILVFIRDIFFSPIHKSLARCPALCRTNKQTNKQTNTRTSRHLSVISHTFTCFVSPSLSTKVSASLHSSPLLDRASTLPHTNSARNFRLVRVTCFPHSPSPIRNAKQHSPVNRNCALGIVQQYGHRRLVYWRRCAPDLSPLTRSGVYGSEDTFVGRAHSKCSRWSNMDTHGYREICRLRDLVAVRFVASCGGIWTL